MPELSTGAQIAIMLIVLSVVISVVFTILGFTRSATAEGMTGVQNSLDAMMLSQHDDYDQKTLSGAQVVSALRLQQGKPWAAVVVNRKPNSDVVNEGTKTLLDTNGFDVDWHTGHNYNALLSGAQETTPLRPTPWVRFQSVDNADLVTSPVAETHVVRHETVSWYTADLKLTADGSLLFNNNIVFTGRSGKDEYIRPTARYMARLIKDTTGTIVGAAFIQIS